MYTLQLTESPKQKSQDRQSSSARAMALLNWATTQPWCGMVWSDDFKFKKRGQKSANPEKSLPPTKPSPKSKNYKVHLQFWTISGQFDFELIPFRKQF